MLNWCWASIDKPKTAMVIRRNAYQIPAGLAHAGELIGRGEDDQNLGSHCEDWY